MCELQSQPFCNGQLKVARLILHLSLCPPLYHAPLPTTPPRPPPPCTLHSTPATVEVMTENRTHSANIVGPNCPLPLLYAV